jgi:hypothetical protein
LIRKFCASSANASTWVRSWSVTAWLAPGISETSNAFTETFGSGSSYSRSCSRFSRLRRRTMARPLEKRQSLGPHRVIAQGHRNPFRMRRAGSALACYTPDSIKEPDHKPKVLAPMAVGSKKVATGTYLRMEVRSNMLTAPDRALTRSSYLFSRPTKGGRQRSNARRGGCSIPTWPRGPRT